MPREPGIYMAKSAAEYVLGRYFGVTTLVFDAPRGKRLRMAREEMRLTQKQMAEQLGLTQTDICRMELGKNITNAPDVNRFKSVLGKYFEHVLFKDGYFRSEDLTVEYDKQTRKFWAEKAK